MGTKKSDCVAMFPESIEKVQKSMPKETELDKVVSFFKVLPDDTRIRILSCAMYIWKPMSPM